MKIKDYAFIVLLAIILEIAIYTALPNKIIAFLCAFLYMITIILVIEITELRQQINIIMNYRK